ncbi:MAG TPA: glycosyltransferase family 2 protein [Rhizomicrobium sp.]
MEAAISDRVAHARQIWHSWEPDATAITSMKFIVDAAQVVEEAKLLQMQNTWIKEQWLGKARVRAMTYEELTARLDHGANFTDVAEFIGGKPREAAPELRHKKVTKIEDVVENLDEVKSACAAAGLSLYGTAENVSPDVHRQSQPLGENDGGPVQVSVAICSYNRYALLSEAIASVLAQEGEVSWELLVIDNSPDRETAEKFGDAYTSDSRIRYIYEERPGLSNARNVALRLARGSIISFLDDDAIASPHWVEKTWEAFEQLGEKIAVVGGKIEPIWGVQKPDWLPESQLGYVTVVDWGGALRVAGENEWVAGANISFRCEPLRRVGGFETSLGRIGAGISLLSNEDIAVTNKLKDAGYLIGYAPDASVRHLVPESRLSREFFRRRAVWQAVSDMIGAEARSTEEYSARRDAALDYLSRMPVRDRNVRGLWREPETPEEFRQQLGALYSFAIAMMAGFPG